VNAANAKYVRLSIGGRPFSIIGTDAGLISEPQAATEVLVTPGERADLAVGPLSAGEMIDIESLPRSGRVGTRALRDGAGRRRCSFASREVDAAGSAHAVRVGDLQVWDLVNDTGSDHPFHVHGFFFQVIAVDGEAPPVLSWKDAVNVRRQSEVRIAWLPDDRPGEWMYHCHILEHHAMGMMAHFAVVA